MAPRKLVTLILRAARDELRGGLPCLGSERRAPLRFFEPCSGVELGPGSRPARGQRRSRSALGLRFRVSRLGGARRVVSGYHRDFLLDVSLLRDGPRPLGAPRLALADFINAQWAFLGLSAYEDARALGRRRRVSWGLDYHFNGLSRTNLVQTPAFVLGPVRLLAENPSCTPARVLTFFRRWLGIRSATERVEPFVKNPCPIAKSRA